MILEFLNMGGYGLYIWLSYAFAALSLISLYYVSVKKLKNEKKFFLMEPIMKVEVTSPMDYQGSIAGSLSSRRGCITDTESKGGNSVIIKADVPLAEMFGYIQTLRGMTQGRATFSMTFGFYEKVPTNIQDSLTKVSEDDKV